MKAIKIFGTIFILLAVIVAGVVMYVFNNLNAIVKEAVETIGPKVTETSVSLGEVDIELLEGKGALKYFVIGNPKGFDSDYLLKWDNIGLQIDPASVSSDVVVIKDFSIEGVSILAEQKGYSTNIQKLLDNLNKGGASEGQSSEASGGEADIRLALERLKFSDNSLNLVTEKFGSYTVDIPSFELTNIGDKSKGLTPEEMAEAILKPLLEKAKDAAEDKIKGIGEEELKAKLEEKKAELKAKVDEEKEALKAKADEKKAELAEKLDEKTSELSDKVSEEDKDALKEKLKEKEDKLKGFFK